MNSSKIRYVKRLAVASIIIVAFLYFATRHVNRPYPNPEVHLLENFPLAASANASHDLPPIPKWNKPPDVHVPELTPLLIGFSQNWPILQQTIVSYLTAGWPAADIYVVDNTGTMLSNRESRLTETNPSYMNYHRLEIIFGVNVISTPTFLSFAQLQNFFLSEALHRNWTHYFWSHMDVVAFSTECEDQYQSLYMRAVNDLRTALTTGEWAVRLYAYDRLSLISTAAMESIGGYDTFIPHYAADCDFYGRLDLAGYNSPSPFIGEIFDVATTLEDVEVLYYIGPPGSDSFNSMFQKLSEATSEKNKDGERNTWQTWQRGGQNEPYYYDSHGREVSQNEMSALGRRIFKLKWGSKSCRPLDPRGAWSPRGSWF